ncbi:MAG: TetR/AcrR family transcriptional regulator [Gordonia sp. (in: high G+C Gram-positive bacteria)]
MSDVIARDGLAAVTVSAVAQAAGLKRTLVGHYFTSREELVSQYLDRAVSGFGAMMLDVASDVAPGEAAERMLADDLYGGTKYLTVWLELVASAGRYEALKSRLNYLWTQVWLPRVEAILTEYYPGNDPARISEVAFCLSSLVEAYWAFRAQLEGDWTLRKTQTLNGCRVLLAQLE